MWKITPEHELLELPEPAEGRSRTRTAWVPTEELIFFHPEMLAGRKKLWRQTVPFVLEDQLVAPVEKMHFALGKAVGTMLPVATVLRRQMDAWLELFDQEKAAPRELRPDIYALPWEEGRLTVWHEGERCLLRTGRDSGFAGSLNWVASLVSVHPGASHLNVFSNDIEALPDAWRQKARPLHAPLDEMLVRTDDADDAINLLQADYLGESSVGGWVRPWRWAASLGLILLAGHIAGMSVEMRMLDQHTNELRRYTTELFKMIAVQDEDIFDLRAQVSRRLKQLEEYQVRRKTNPWDLAALIERPLSACKNCRVETFDLYLGRATLEVSAHQDLDKLSAELSGLGGVEIKVSKQSDREDGRKQARFEITLS